MNTIVKFCHQLIRNVSFIYILQSQLTNGLESFTKVYHTAVAIIPPPGLVYDQLMKTRECLGDRDYHKWPPHINLLYPFVESSKFDSVIPILVEALKDVKPFELILSDFGVFGCTSYRGIFRGVLWANPIVQDYPDSLINLQGTLEAAMPFCTEQRLKYGAYHPHMTLSNYKTVDEATAAAIKLKKSWTSLTFKVTEVCITERDDETRVMARVPLGRS